MRSILECVTKTIFAIRMSAFDSKKITSMQHRFNMPYKSDTIIASALLGVEFCNAFYHPGADGIAYRKYPAAVACSRNDLDELLTRFRYRSEDQLQTTNHQCCRTTLLRSTMTDKAHGSLHDKPALTPILFAVFSHEKQGPERRQPFPADAKTIDVTVSILKTRSSNN